MALKELYLGSVGPLLYEDSDFPNGIQCEGPISVGTGTDADNAARIDDLPTLTDLVSGTPEQGDVIYYNGSSWVALHHGNANDVLTSGGNGANPSWTAVSGGSGNWNTDSDTWVYVSATSFKIVGKDVRSRFDIGVKVSWTQTNSYYGYVVAIAMSGSDTLITVVGHAVLNAVITAAFYSYAASPIYFPHWFDLTEVWDGFSVAPAGGTCRFKIEGRRVIQHIWRNTNGTSNANTCTVSLAVAARTLANYATYKPLIINNNGWQDTMGYYYIASGDTVATLFKSVTSASNTWAATGDKNATGELTWEI